MSGVGIELHGVGFEGCHGILQRVYGMRKEDDIIIVLEHLVYPGEVLVHFRANAFTGGKEVFHHYNFIFNIFISDGFAILIEEGEGGHMMIGHIAEDGQGRFFGLLAAYLIVIGKESDTKQYEKGNKEYSCFIVFHGAKLINGWKGNCIYYRCIYPYGVYIHNCYQKIKR